MRNRPDMGDRTVFSTKTALAEGFTAGQLRAMREERLLQGVYSTEPDLTTLHVRARAALVAAGPSATLCETTALRLAGVSMPRRFEADERVHVHVAHDRSGPRRSGVCRHRSTQQLPPTIVAGLPSLNLAECWLQTAARATDEELVVLGDGLMRRPRPPDHLPYLVEPQALAAAVADSPRRPGIRAARRAIEIVRPRTDSPMESVTRFHLVRSGLPMPLVNHPILDDTGWPIYFIDMAYVDAMVAVEYDGADHFTNPAQTIADLRRRRHLEADGWRFIIVTADDLADQMITAVGLVRTALRDRAARPPKSR